MTHPISPKSHQTNGAWYYLFYLFAAAVLMAAPVRAVGKNPIVVELFESQGCSSCPPSERVMRELRKNFGDNVLLLTFHVDYWDYLGWKDTFSNPLYTERQKMYGRQFKQDSIYTPEMVIQGEKGFVGSDGNKAFEEITFREAASRPAFTINVTKVESGDVTVSVKLPSELARHAREVVAVFYEDAPEVHVLRGENAGVTMSGDSAVRLLVPIRMASSSEGKVTISKAKLSSIGTSATIAVLIHGESSAILSAQKASMP